MSFNPDPPRLAEQGKAQSCLALNLLVLPGLGTFIHGARLRGGLEILLSLSGFFWLCKILVFAVIEFFSLGDGVLHLRNQLPQLISCLVLIVGAWFSGFQYGRRALQQDHRSR